MAVYRFRVSFEDYDDVIREIDIKSTQTFEDLHKAIHTATGYNPELSSSFYVSNDQWIKGDEIAYLPTERKLNRGVKLMGNTKLSTCIDDPHQKFYYTYNFDRPFDFHIELMKILLNEELGKTYPNTFKSVGEVPKLVVNNIAPTEGAATTEDEFDFIHEMDFAVEDTEELETMSDMGINAEDDHHEEEEEKDDYMDEFSDNDHFESDDSNKDDY